MTTRTLAYKRPGTLRNQVFKLALPAVGEQSLNMLVGLADVYLVGNMAAAAIAYLGYGPAVGLAAVGLANYIIWLVITLYMAGAIGSTALIARATGASEWGEANTVVRQSLLLGLSMGLLGLLIMYGIAPLAMQFFGAPPVVALLGISYLRIVAFSMPLTGVMFMLNAALRGAGDTRTPLLIMGIINGVNILVSWMLISGQFGLPTLGVVGAAWGTTIGRSLGGLLVIAILLRGRGRLRIDRWPRPNGDMLRRILRVGLPTGGEMLVFQGALLIFARFVTQLGTVAYAAYNVVIQAHSISFMPGLGFAIAATTLVGQGLGAKDVQRARQSGHEATVQAALFMGFIGIFFVLFPQWFLSLLVDAPDVIAAGTTPLRVVGFFEPLIALNFVYAGALRGAGDTRWPLLTKLVSPWLIRLPLALILIPLYGVTGAIIAMSIDLSVQGLLVLWRFLGSSWERVNV